MSAPMFRSAPPGGGDRKRLELGLGHGGFDPRPRVGATAGGQRRELRFDVFRSAPPGGGDDLIRVKIWLVSEFRSAPPGGGDAPRPSNSGTRGVSIRAPGWGRPPVSGPSPVSMPCFDPRPRVGATFGKSGTELIPLLFRSAPPGGGDPPTLDEEIRALVFRSAPPGGGDMSTRDAS